MAGFDYFNYHWNFWFLRYISQVEGINAYLNDFVFYPALTNYGYHAYAAFWHPLWALLEPFFGTLTAFNVIIFVACTLNGYLLFLWLRREGVSVALALMGGIALQTFPIARYWYYNTHINLMNWFWLPLHLLLWSQTVSAVRARSTPRAIFWAMVQGVALYGLAMSDHQFPIFAAFVIVPYGLLSLWRARREAAQLLGLIGAGVLTVATGIALLWQFGYLSYALQFRGTLAPGKAAGRPGVAARLFSMAETWWQWDTPSLGAFVTLSALIALAAALFVPQLRHRHDGRWFWFWVGVPPFLIALGGAVQIGDLSLPTPYHLLHALTGGMFGMPWRLAPIFVISTAIFAGKVFTPLLIGRRRAQLVFIVGAFLANAWAVRLWETAPLTPVPTPYAFYAEIGAEHGALYDRLVLVEVPTGVATGEVILGDPRAVQLQWYGMFHHKRMINGFISRAPVEHFFYIETGDPMLSWLGGRVPLDADFVRRQMEERVFSYPIGYFVVHRDLIGRESATLTEIFAFFNRDVRDLVCPVWIEGDAVAYRTAAHPDWDGCPQRVPPNGVIDIGALDDARFIGRGWHYPEIIAGITARWTGAEAAARLYVRLPERRAYEVTLSAQAFGQVRQLALFANGVSLGSVDVLPEGLAEYTFILPEEILLDGYLELALAYDLSGQDESLGRTLGVLVDWLRLAPLDEGRTAG
ncbi:MAG: hypothetical protein CUN51_05440 [Candidatus Thermofonsia Clade 1 bacterium]|uniref:Glycosyltransferase RgtA/B/C/D-like domain-containing protein n=1 Tax=Candidatus Thermofonsia Clade 1 bacterium TaxID=2364210 RepID=A0A2M8P061_9CHLR|nr:MAG: hypothetical protein CUN51_05440 [Candidatus Thermofonsia Clade 1 bacterium]